MIQTEDMYEGYTNKQTWAAVLWQDNNEGLFNTMWHFVKDAPDAPTALKRYWEVTLSTEHYVNEAGVSVPDWVYAARNDLGSLHDINWVEVAQCFMESAREQGLM